MISKQKERDARISNLEVCHLKLLKRAKGMHVISQRAQGYATSRLISDRPLLLGVPAGLLDIPFPPKKVMYVKVYIKFGEKEKCKEE